jgi:hypothetical protein
VEGKNIQQNYSVTFLLPPSLKTAENILPYEIKNASSYTA